MKADPLSDKIHKRLDEVTITPLRETHLSDAWGLWKAQYEEELSANQALPDRWNENQGEIQSFLRKRANSGYAMIAEDGKDTIGYMLFDIFPFHGEATAFCPIVGHAAIRNYRGSVLERLYQSLSETLVAHGILNHTITYFAHDGNLEDTVFGLGFGLIVVDAFRGLNTNLSLAPSFDIIKADSSHVQVLEELGEESRNYYLEAPLFLTREKQSRKYYKQLLEGDSAIFLAFRGDEPVGFMQIRKSKELDLITLCDMNTGLIDEMGAYIKLKYRRQGIGGALLSKCIQWGQNRGLQRIHVDFESANLQGRSFWSEHFTAAMHSARRAVYRDVLRAP